MKYLEIKEKQKKEIESLPIYFAFGNKQLEEKVKELGFKNVDEMLENVTGIGAGGFVLVKDYDKVMNTFTKQREELKNLIDNDDEFVIDAFEYELGNHEFVITYDITETLNSLNIKYDMYKENERLQDLMEKAKNKYLEEMKKLGW